MIITQKVQKWGNGTAIRLPKKVLDEANLGINQVLEITLSGKSILLTPIKTKKSLTLDSILDGVTPDMVGGELDWGPAVGKEIW